MPTLEFRKATAQSRKVLGDHKRGTFLPNLQYLLDKCQLKKRKAPDCSRKILGDHKRGATKEGAPAC